LQDAAVELFHLPRGELLHGVVSLAQVRLSRESVGSWACLATFLPDQGIIRCGCECALR